MALWDSVSAALHALATRKLRSALTMLGIIIGVSAVISLLAVGKGVQAEITRTFQSMGTNLLVIQPGAPTREGMIAGMFGTGATLTLDDARAIASSPLARAVSAVAPEDAAYAQVSAGNENIRVLIAGVTPEYHRVVAVEVAQGTFVSQEELNRRASVAVLASMAAETLFPSSNPVGKSIRIEGSQYQVIGVLKSRGGGGLLGLQDQVIMVPLTTLQSKLSAQRLISGNKKDAIMSINIQVRNAEDVFLAKEQVASILRARHHIRPGQEDDFNVMSMNQALQMLEQVTGIFTAFLAIIASISLVVGGIGIMNIMLVSVTERTREIGIRKAVGARRTDILKQFLIEAATLSFLGGAMGTLLGWGISRLASQFKLGGYPVKAVVSLDTVALAVSVAIAIGIISGLYPAVRAARLNPIDALRYE